MWDGREPDLENQAVDATLGHAQAATPPRPTRWPIVDFQKGIFTGQIFDKKAKFLTDDNAKGGPVALSLHGQFFHRDQRSARSNPKERPLRRRSSISTVPG